MEDKCLMCMFSFNTHLGDLFFFLIKNCQASLKLTESTSLKVGLEVFTQKALRVILT